MFSSQGIRLLNRCYQSQSVCVFACMCTGITSNKVLVVATGANSLHVAWWSGDASVVARYSILCSTLYTASNKTAVDQHRVTQFTDEAINSLNVDNLVPLTCNIQLLCC